MAARKAVGKLLPGTGRKVFVYDAWADDPQFANGQPKRCNMMELNIWNDSNTGRNKPIKAHA